ncbi:LacI family DNA-binding transcriptional regulator [Promicromonospora vindobonensis]|uniref:LacI family DNA-binding transcriptional regulator n=1 Tax=Promicromonospora vindobonensis TaxID=195748 RepID=A0ABW5VUR3_9MICO
MSQREDVARLAGVSARTVSNVVSGSVNVTPGTRERVRAAIEQLDYRPSEIGRMLRSGRSGMAALVVPDLDNPYFAELARELIEAARRHGYTLMIEQTDGVRDRERELLARADTKAIFDGLIVSPLDLTDDDLSRASRTQRPVVLLGEESHPGFDHVQIDNFAAAREAVEHLLAMGSERVVAVGAQRTRRSSSSLRLSGFEEAMGSDAGASSDVAYVDSFSRRGGAEATRRILDGRTLPDALFCFSDLLALGAMRALHDAGVSVPEQVAVVGFDDIEDGRYGRPSLTTVSPDKAAIADAAMDALARRIGGDDSEPRRVLAPHRLVERESTRR